MKYKIFGCKVNKYYLNQRLGFFEQSTENTDDLFLISTCEVTDRAKSKWLRETKQAIKSGMRVAITGCGTLRQGKLIEESAFYALYPELLERKDKILLLGEAPEGEEQAAHTMFTPATNVYTKHFLMIQNGCDNHCSFCLTVMKRGKHWSRPLEEIIREIQEVEANGGKEIVLTGVNLAAWGCSDTKKAEETKFPQLLEAILRQTTIPRIRISSIGPEYANDAFLEVVQNPRIMPHFHFSIQSFSNHVLGLMRRRYDKRTLHSLLTALRVQGGPGVSLGADLIVGFPGETEEDFLETLRGVEEFGITKAHIFPFSAHLKGETIPAFYFPDQVPLEIKKEREKRLIEVADRVRAEFIRAHQGTVHDVLLEERGKNGKWKGRTENYLPVEIDGMYHRGDIVRLTY